MGDGTQGPAFRGIFKPHGAQGRWVLLPSFPSAPGRPAHDPILAHLSPSHLSPRLKSPRALEGEPRLRGLKEKMGHWGCPIPGGHCGRTILSLNRYPRPGTPTPPIKETAPP